MGHLPARIGLVTMTIVAAACSSGGTTTTTVAVGASDCAIDAQGAASIATAKLIIEYNATDGDLGVLGQFDDDGWSELCLLDPDGTPILVITPESWLGDLTIGSVFFESREPPLEEFGFTELAERFPAGEYRVLARSYDGETLEGAARFTHDVPAEPEITAPDLAEDEDAAGEAVIPTGRLTVSWEPVTGSVDGGPVEITAYEVIITKVDHDDPNGFSTPVYDVHLAAEATSLDIPAGFLEPGALYELEVLALEMSGNQTIAVGFFTTQP